MSYHDQRHCRCGSGLSKYPLYDAAGIFCDYACDKCEARKRKSFAPAMDPRSAYSWTGEEKDIGYVPGEDY